MPIIPGLKPLASLAQVEILPKVFHIQLPEDLKNEAIKCKNNTQVKELGIEWCIKQSKELIEQKLKDG